MTLFEFAFFFIHRKIYSKVDKVISLILQSTIFNIGSSSFLIFYPVFIKVYIEYKYLFLLFLFALAIIFCISIAFSIKLDVSTIINNSIDIWFNKKKIRYNVIFFYKDTIPKYIYFIAIIIYMLILSLLLISFFYRSNIEAMYYFSQAILLLNAILFYSDFCYIILSIKYFYLNKER
ncbi:hypothetical protein RO21_04410 [[Actinobacillus] muris]|uniref:Uncharacterized protein n=1 Tax=Muribacter muris TaxID=67855 RepID=A0A0J5S4R7_9PAST|nr:hypothetical protein RO21_04410 [[Actinobacillus] muris] [Muribacter muris]